MNELVDGPVTVHVGDALSVLRQLPSESVHCVVTSPAYWQLRDYGASGQLGLEPTPELYVEHLVEVFREVRRVLHPSGSVWCNLGDSYATGAAAHTGYSDKSTLSGFTSATTKGRETYVNGERRNLPPGLKPKDLVGIPWRVAFALQADGWWLRSDIVWSKPNPMPESVTDRPTKAHEYLFLLTKAERYFYDAAAVREAGSLNSHPGHPTPNGMGNGQLGRNGRFGGEETSNGRNLRSVWTIATQPYPEAHFATFPEDLVIPCIKAGTSEHGVCPQCGSPWVRMVERETSSEGRQHWAGRLEQLSKGASRNGGFYDAKVTTRGWQSSCAHGCEPIPATVLDPFAGSGTTLSVARRLGRRSIGIELQAGYLPLIAKRIAVGALPLLELLQGEEVKR